MWFDEMHLYTVDPVYNTNKYLYPPTLFYTTSLIECYYPMHFQASCNHSSHIASYYTHIRPQMFSQSFK